MLKARPHQLWYGVKIRKGTGAKSRDTWNKGDCNVDSPRQIPILIFGG